MRTPPFSLLAGARPFVDFLKSCCVFSRRKEEEGRAIRGRSNSATYSVSLVLPLRKTKSKHQLLEANCVLDFVDVNMGCPIGEHRVTHVFFAHPSPVVLPVTAFATPLVVVSIIFSLQVFVLYIVVFE